MCVGAETNCTRFLSFMKSQNQELIVDVAVNVDQSMSGELKSPRMIMSAP